MTRQQFNIKILPEIKEQLGQMADADHRTMGNMIEHLIRQEHARRQHPRQMTDESGRYRWVEEVME